MKKARISFRSLLKTAVSGVLGMALILGTMSGCGGSSTSTGGGAASAGSSAAAGKSDDDNFHITIKLSHVFQPQEQVYKTMEAIGKSVTEKTQGHITIQVFGQGQLSVYNDSMEQVKRGANWIAVEEPSYLGDYVPDFAALVGPMLYQNNDEWEKMQDTDLYKEMQKKAEDLGFHFLSMNYEFGFRSLCTNKDVKTPDDLKGMKLRSTESPLFVKTIEAMGAAATPMAFTECISAIQTGTVNGFEGSESTLLGTGAYEVVKKVALTRHFIATRGAFINTKVYDSIPEKYRKILDEEFAQGAKDCRAASEKDEAGTVEKLKSLGVTFNDVDMDAFTKSCDKVYDWLVSDKKCSPDIHERLLAELKKMRG
ncbi:C4-dicarboxylate ABC transporter substrate-binding protein [Caproiciproducens sp. NJN-50]|uniref:C4-dicarboxylate TRAP transporter substrate-binding protein n=1 Tax=Acutalibacteraceae TaxID=3082771 RepID=UPI000FFE20D5|nr:MULTISPECIES: C4-dicarboxylate TRAP transporter substrate-binding protein [Acutalibacteraceae]QAT49037.1 C4-dicarboxylate ABC transporter substrate-binding protein [Caproiciproducens sp. NJN-50]